MPSDQFELLTFDIELFRQQFDHRRIGATVFRRSRDGDFESAGLLTFDQRLASARLNSEGQDAALGVSGYCDQDAGSSVPSNSTEPSRISVAPSSMAISKSLLIPIES
jgi:hypothetical protein